MNKYDYKRAPNQAVVLPTCNCPECARPFEIEQELDWDGTIFECFCYACEIRWWVNFE